MSRFNQLPPLKTIDQTVTSLKANGISASWVETGTDANRQVLKLLPPKAEVMNMTSVTLETIGLTQEILQSEKYQPVRHKLETMDRNTQAQAMNRLSSAPQWALGSVHAVTQTGEVLIASNTGSQLPAYSYGAEHVIWVVGAQKIVKDINEGIDRIYQHCLPLENKRAQKAYGSASAVSKILIINQEIKPERITLILVNQVLGF